jgi:type 1 fimbriae regulatory protein FimB
MPKFLTEAEIYRLIDATAGERHETRDACILLWMFRRGWRASEAAAARLDHLRDDLTLCVVERLKGGVTATHVVDKEERAVMKAWLRVRAANKGAGGPAVFLPERGEALTREGIRHLVRRYAVAAGIGKAHPHMLRHACGYALANQGEDTRLIQTYMGHSSITSTQLYTETNPERFRGMWSERKTGNRRRVR